MSDWFWIHTKSVHVAVYRGTVVRTANRLVYEPRHNDVVHVPEHSVGIFVEEIV